MITLDKICPSISLLGITPSEVGKSPGIVNENGMNSQLCG